MKRKKGEYYIGITTVKPNKEGFETHKRKLRIGWHCASVRTEMPRFMWLLSCLTIPSALNPISGLVPILYSISHNSLCKKSFGIS